MTGEWRELSFSEAVLINPAISMKSGQEYWFVDMGALMPGTRHVYPSERRKFSGSGSRFVTGDTLMARITPCLENGKIACYCGPEDEPAHGSTEFIVIRGREGVSDTAFAYYLTKWNGVSGYAISQMTGSSGRQRVPTSAFEHLMVLLPPLPEQRAIAHILGTLDDEITAKGGECKGMRRILDHLISKLVSGAWSVDEGREWLLIARRFIEPLDDKIELNRRMNETLEALAQALFKAWFVDFEPVRAKMEGRWQRGQSLPGLPAHLYDLFPARLIASELGEIPEGWEIGHVGDVLAELVSGGRPSGGAVTEGVPSIGAENIIGLGRYDFSKEKYVPREFFEKLQQKGSAVRPGDVLIYKDGAQIGRKSFFDCGFPHTKCAVNEHVFIIRCKRPYWQRYLFFWLDQGWMTQGIVSLNSNSAQPGINQQSVRTLPLLVALDPVVQAFDRLSKPLTDRLFASCLESRTLAALRDTLLPNLISGKLRVKEAEQFLEEAGV